MPETSNSEVSTSNAQLGVLGLAVLFISATAGATFFLVGDLTETDPVGADYLWRPWTFLNEHETVIGVVSMVVWIVSGVALVLARRAGRVPAPLLAVVIVMALFASWLGLGYRVTTAGVIGANIGGGVVMLLTPVLAVVAIALLLGMALRASNRAK